MSRQDELAAAYLAVRPRLLRLAYTVLGSATEAEDVVSDVWLRLVPADARDPVRDVEGWAVVAVGRRALDVLESARVRRETYVGPWLPEPWLERPSSDGVDPADRVTLDESVSYALLVVLESLSPAERTAFVLHDVFGLPFPEVAEAVGRTPAAVRQLASRARRRVADQAPRTSVTRAEHDEVLAAFGRAIEQGDLQGLLAVLDPGVVVVSDGGGAVHAARRPVEGAERAAQFLLGIRDKGLRARPDVSVRPALVNGAGGLVVLEGDHVAGLATFTTRAGRITAIHIVVAPDKLVAAGRGRPAED